MLTKVNQIGFLDVASDFTFKGGTLTLSSEFRKAKRWVERNVNEDGFVYPGTSYKVGMDLETRCGTRISKTTRPALLYRMPPSHDLILKGARNVQKSRLGIAGFVTQCFAFLFGTRLQFSDWWVEGRIPIKSTVNVHVAHHAAEEFLSKAISTWKAFNRRDRIIASNMLYLFAKSGSLEWDWERFQMEYTVFDTCFALASRRQPWSGRSHKERFKNVCKFYGLRYNESLVRKFVYLRNDLIHEALWDGGQVNTARGSFSSIASYHLRNLNHRLITAMLTSKTEYTQSPWWFSGTFAFKA